MSWKKNPIAKLLTGGFTLVETGIAIVIASGLLTGATGLIKPWVDQSAIRTNQQRMATIQQALASYVAQHNRLPCPASFIAQTSAVIPAKVFGREITYPATTGCPSPFTPDGLNTFQVKNAAARIFGPVTSNTIIVGAVPVRDLGLPDSLIKNTYGYYFTYAVTQFLTNGSTTAAMDNTLGVIEVLDQNGNDALPKPPVTQAGKGTALYALVDHGKDGKGAYTGGTTGPAIACPAMSTTLDSYNCNFTAAYTGFRDVPESRKPGATWSDDTVVYNTTFSQTGQVCTTVHASSLLPGTSTGYDLFGTDAGAGAGVGVPFTVIFVTVMPFTYAFLNWFHFSDNPTANYVGNNSSVNATTAQAYCPDTTFNVVTGGCSYSKLGAAYGADVNLGLPATSDGVNTGYFAEIALPPQSHPVLPGAVGVQGWECNGSPGSLLTTNVYAICCTGGGG